MIKVRTKYWRQYLYILHTLMQTAAMLRVLQMKQLTGPRPSRFGQEHDSMCTSFLTAKSIVVSASARWRGRLRVGGPNFGDLEREYLRLMFGLGGLMCAVALMLCCSVFKLPGSMRGGDLHVQCSFLCVVVRSLLRSGY